MIIYGVGMRICICLIAFAFSFSFQRRVEWRTKGAQHGIGRDPYILIDHAQYATVQYVMPSVSQKAQDVEPLFV